MKNKVKRKRYHDAKCRKELRLRTRYRSWGRRFGLMNAVPISDSQNHRGVLFRLQAPERLDIFNDTENALAFFSRVLTSIEKCHFKDTLYFDLSQVEVITPDAIMYIIAIIKNARRIRMLNIGCAGNMPASEEARETIKQSGFFSFVSSTPLLRIETNNRYMKIANGKDVKNELAGSFCDFVHASCRASRLDTKRLYPMIVELMTNTSQHAYSSAETTIMQNNWYIFAQNTEDTVRFVFLDTGVGIPQTVTKKFREKIRGLLVQNDANYLKSTLQGEFRTETKQEHRGKGIPGIYEDACNHAVFELSIISGQGKCEVHDNGDIEATSLKQTFEGTLFAWDIAKPKVEVQ